MSADYEDFEDFWAPFTSGVGPAGAFCAGLDPVRQEALFASCLSARRLGDPNGAFQPSARGPGTRSGAPRNFTYSLPANASDLSLGGVVPLKDAVVARRTHVVKSVVVYWEMSLRAAHSSTALSPFTKSQADHTKITASAALSHSPILSAT